MSFVRVGNPVRLQPSRHAIAAQTFGAGAFSPAQVAGLVAWFKADSLTLNNDDPVATWPDSSGNGNNATQATAGKRPLFKTNIQNGLPVVRSDTTDDAMATAAFAVGMTQPTTIFAVTAAIDADIGFFDGIGASNRNLLFINTGQWDTYAGVELTGGASDTAFHIHTCVFNGASSSHRTGGGVADAAGDAGTQTLTGLTLFSNYLAGGGAAADMGELILIQGSPANSVLNSIGDYLEARWALTWTTI